jgi:hypothetical protein
MNARAVTNKTEIEWWRALPFPYVSCNVTSGSRPDGFSFYPHIINIEADLLGRTVWACGEAHEPELAMTKAVAELLERSALITWKIRNSSRALSSNGWAAHSSADAAKSAATLELIERDAALSHWYTATPFLEIPFNELPISIQEWRHAELSKSEFPNLKILFTTVGLGPSVTCLFLNDKGFGVSSHSTRTTLLESIESAIGEACRAAHMALRKSFWRETLALRDNEAIAVGPGAHSVYYAYHEPFPNWMFGSSVTWEPASKLWSSRIDSARNSEMDFKIVLHQPLVVGFASHKLAFPLTWGPTDKEYVLATAASMRFAVQPTEWNLKPHIIS